MQVARSAPTSRSSARSGRKPPAGPSKVVHGRACAAAVHAGPAHAALLLLRCDPSCARGIPAKDEDRTAVLRLFELMGIAFDGLDGGVQIIVGDHANPHESWFRVRYNWRDGEASCPRRGSSGTAAMRAGLPRRPA
ncbi:DUF3732 domain-containing protein [Streptomyces sp. NPDC056568]|uniref:DUF3732 domain-containing protein n=1 Tax=Streptomyces sp. NPDC056568 TaxID=3345866 RepID=UPI0036992937